MDTLLQQLPHRYAALVDERDRDGVVELFAPNGELATPDPPRSLGPTVLHRGHEQIRSAFDALDDLLLTFHSIVGVVIEEAGPPGSALGRVACVAHHVSEGPDGPLRVTWYMRYRDIYAREAIGWVFLRRQIFVDFIEHHDVAQVLSR